MLNTSDPNLRGNLRYSNFLKLFRPWYWVTWVICNLIALDPISTAANLKVELRFYNNDQK